MVVSAAQIPGSKGAEVNICPDSDHFLLGFNSNGEMLPSPSQPMLCVPANKFAWV